MKKLLHTVALFFSISFSGYAQSITLILRDPDMKAPTNVRAKPGGDIQLLMEEKLILRFKLLAKKEITSWLNHTLVVKLMMRLH